MAVSADELLVPTVRKTVSYRKVLFHNAPGVPTLEQLLGTAQAKVPIAQKRRQGIDETGSELRYISDWGALKNGGVYGRLSTVQKGKSPVALLDNDTAKTIPLTAFSPPKGHDYCPGMCHFIAIGNHVVMTQSQLLRTSHLEAHLVWLLRDTKLLEQDQGITLSDEPTKATKERIRRSHVKSVSLGRPVLDEMSVVSKKGKSRKSFKADVNGTFFQMLKSLVTDQGFERLDLANGVFRSNLEVWLEIRYPKRSRVQSAESRKLLDDLSLALRDEDANDVKLELNDGSVVTGKELKVTGHVDVQLRAGGQFSEPDLYEQMKDSLKNWIKNGIILPN